MLTPSTIPEIENGLFPGGFTNDDGIKGPDT